MWGTDLLSGGLCSLSGVFILMLQQIIFHREKIENDETITFNF